MLSIKIVKKKNSSWTKGDKPWKINIFQGLPPFVQEDIFWDHFYWPQVYKELIPKNTSKGYCKEIQNSRHLVSTQVVGFIMWHSLIYYSMVITCKTKLMFFKISCLHLEVAYQIIILYFSLSFNLQNKWTTFV
jgi:hypothetical protein